MVPQRFFRVHGYYLLSGRRRGGKKHIPWTCQTIYFWQDFGDRENFILFSRKLDNSIRNCRSCIYRQVVITQHCQEPSDRGSFSQGARFSSPLSHNKVLNSLLPWPVWEKQHGWQCPCQPACPVHPGSPSYVEIWLETVHDPRK